jgi:hypothetical protein
VPIRSPYFECRYADLPTWIMRRPFGLIGNDDLKEVPYAHELDLLGLTGDVLSAATHPVITISEPSTEPISDVELRT